MNDSLHEFIVKALAQGQSSQQIRTELLSVGWDPMMVDAAITNTSSLARPRITQISATTKMAGQRAIVLGALVIVLTGGGVIGGTLYMGKQKASEPPLQIAATNPTNAPHEASDAAYIAYNNLEYGFSIHIPKTWSVKEFPPNDYNGEKRIAIGFLELLPKEFFIQGDYIWLKIYSKQNSSDYSDFLYLNSQLDKNESVEHAQLDGANGLRTNDFVAVEHNNQVYELHLLEALPGEYKYRYSDESRLILDSFKFI